MRMTFEMSYSEHVRNKVSIEIAVSNTDVLLMICTEGVKLRVHDSLYVVVCTGAYMHMSLSRIARVQYLISVPNG
jgi:hypothetical protein